MIGQKDHGHLVKYLKVRDSAEAAKTAGAMSPTEAEEAIESAWGDLSDYAREERNKKLYNKALIESWNMYLATQKAAEGLSPEEAAKLYETEEMKEAMEFLKWNEMDHSDGAGDSEAKSGALLLEEDPCKEAHMANEDKADVDLESEATEAPESAGTAAIVESQEAGSVGGFD